MAVISRTREPVSHLLVSGMLVSGMLVSGMLHLLPVLPRMLLPLVLLSLLSRMLLTRDVLSRDVLSAGNKQPDICQLEPVNFTAKGLSIFNTYKRNLGINIYS